LQSLVAGMLMYIKGVLFGSFKTYAKLHFISKRMNLDTEIWNVLCFDPVRKQIDCFIEMAIGFPLRIISRGLISIR
jgi:hypothetical protein